MRASTSGVPVGTLRVVGAVLVGRAAGRFQLARHRARVHRDDVDPVLLHLGAQALRGRREASLRGVVEVHARCRRERGHRGDIDDRACPALGSSRQETSVVSRNGTWRSRRSSRSAAAQSVSVARLTIWTPALLTRTSIGPSAPRPRRAMPRLRRRREIERDDVGASCARAAIRSRRSLLRATSVTLAPRARYSRAQPCDWRRSWSLLDRSSCRDAPRTALKNAPFCLSGEGIGYRGKPWASRYAPHRRTDEAFHQEQ